MVSTQCDCPAKVHLMFTMDHVFVELKNKKMQRKSSRDLFKNNFYQNITFLFILITPVYRSSNLGTLRLIDSIGLRVDRPRPSQAVDGFLDILADSSPILMPTSIQPCRTCVLGLFMCYRGWITAVPYMPSIQLWGGVNPKFYN